MYASVICQTPVQLHSDWEREDQNSEPIRTVAFYSVEAQRSCVFKSCLRYACNVCAYQHVNINNGASDYTLLICTSPPGESSHVAAAHA